MTRPAAPMLRACVSGAEADRSLSHGCQSHQFSNGVEDHPELNVVFLLEGVELPGRPNLTSVALSWNVKSGGNRSRFRLTACISARGST
jgi:hypothetical protein